eukprot:4064160-Pleurochrysis_carterae.AAC.2
MQANRPGAAANAGWLARYLGWCFHALCVLALPMTARARPDRPHVTLAARHLFGCRLCASARFHPHRFCRVYGCGLRRPRARVCGCALSQRDRAYVCTLCKCALIARVACSARVHRRALVGACA